MKKASSTQHHATTITRISFRIVCIVILAISVTLKNADYIYVQSHMLYTSLVCGLSALGFVAFLVHVISLIISRKSGNNLLTANETAVYIVADTILGVVCCLAICILLDPNPFPLQL